MISKNVVCVCIGSNQISGDCLGPIVGSYLKRLSDFDVYGDMENPVNFKNAEYIMDLVCNKYSDDLKIIIDSALGNNVGDIIIDCGELEIGKSLNRTKKVFGDLNIRAVVGRDYNNTYKNMMELRSRNVKDINAIAAKVVNTIMSYV